MFITLFLKTAGTILLMLIIATALDVIVRKISKTGN